MQKIKQVLGVLGNLVFTFLMLTLICMVFWVVKGKIDNSPPIVAGNQFYVVLSGSMSPIFNAGSVIATKPVETETIQVGDIITFKDPVESGKVITHRVVGIKTADGVRSFITQGDANQTQDQGLVPSQNVIGKTWLWIPYAGYVLEFAKTKKGLLLLIIIPGALLILGELRNLLRYAREEEEEKELAGRDAA